MSEQVMYALRRAVVMVVLAALAVLAEQQFAILEAVGPNAVIWSPMVGAGIAALVRLVEGKIDSNRASIGEVIPSDVGYGFAKEAALTPQKVPASFDSENKNVYVAS